MSKRGVVEISLKTAKEWYGKGGELKKIALQAYEEKELTELPKSWEKCIMQLEKGECISVNSNIYEITDLNKAFSLSAYYNVLPCDLGKPILALCQLLVCREIYRQGWKPNWSDNSAKYHISFEQGKICTTTSMTITKILTFQSEKVRDEFLKNFKDLIEEAKELI